MVPLLINAPGFNQEKKNAAGMTPLALAAYKGHCHVVEAVLKSGKANVNVEDRFDRNILDLAVCGRNPTVRLVQLLLKTNCFRFSFDQRRPRGRAFAIAAGKKDLYQDISNLLESYYEGQTQQNLAEEDVES
jgi:ankyrin repeat protein